MVRRVILGAEITRIVVRVVFTYFQQQRLPQQLPRVAHWHVKNSRRITSHHDDERIDSLCLIANLVKNLWYVVQRYRMESAFLQQ